MYTSDVSRFKYRVNQPRMYRTNRHINTYRVYGSIISTNIHKPGRCTFFWLQQHPFFSQHLGPFRCVPLMVHLYYYYCWMHIQPDWHICRSGTAIQMKCLRVLSINTDLCSNKITNQKTKKTIITWSLKQMVWLITWTDNTKVIQLWKEHFTYDLPSGNLISFFPSGP